MGYCMLAFCSAIWKKEKKEKKTFLFDLQPNLAKSSFGWSPVHLPHKIEK